MSAQRSALLPPTAPGAAPDRVERRRQPRVPSFLGGRACYGGAFTVPCAIRNLGGGGARLRTDGQPLPDSFDLILIRDGLAMKSQTIWRRAQETGVRFIGAVDLQTPSPQANPLRAIWLQVVPH